MSREYIKNVVTLNLDRDKCIGCKNCETVCPYRIFKIEERKAKIINKDLCIECGACMNNCPTEAITVRKGVGWVLAIVKGILTGRGKKA